MDRSKVEHLKREHLHSLGSAYLVTAVHGRARTQKSSSWHMHCTYCLHLILTYTVFFSSVVV